MRKTKLFFSLPLLLLAMLSILLTGTGAWG
jgi:hypothetical protein